MMNLSWKCQYDLMIFNALKGLEILTAINTPKSYKYPVKIKRLLDTFQDQTEKTQHEPGALVVQKDKEA